MYTPSVGNYAAYLNNRIVRTSSNKQVITDFVISNLSNGYYLTFENWLGVNLRITQTDLTDK